MAAPSTGHGKVLGGIGSINGLLYVGGAQSFTIGLEMKAGLDDNAAVQAFRKLKARQAPFEASPARSMFRIAVLPDRPLMRGYRLPKIWVTSGRKITTAKIRKALVISK